MTRPARPRSPAPAKGCAAARSSAPHVGARGLPQVAGACIVTFPKARHDPAILHAAARAPAPARPRAIHDAILADAPVAPLGYHLPS